MTKLEKVARAMFDDMFAPHERSLWDAKPDLREKYIQTARATLEAAQALGGIDAILKEKPVDWNVVAELAKRLEVHGKDPWRARFILDALHSGSMPAIRAALDKMKEG